MKDIELPPFFVGQRVVAIKNHPAPWNMFTKGVEYSVTSIFRSPCKCSHWYVTIGVSNPYGGSICRICKTTTLYRGEMRFNSSYFAPIEDSFEEISFEQAIAVEKKLTCAN